MKLENGPITLLRFLSVWLALAGTALFLNARSSFELIPGRQNLDTFPRELQGWTGKDSPLSPDILRALGPGDFLSRSYRRSSSAERVDLFIAYYPSQRTGDTIHSPQNCLPGAGWTPLMRGRIQIPEANVLRDGNIVTANRYILAKGLDRILVLYWYQAHGRTTPSEYWAKFYLVRDSMAMNRTDGAMVRVAMAIPNSSAEGQTEAAAIEFSQAVLRNLDSYIPR
jgi:EpsI family protein